MGYASGLLWNADQNLPQEISWRRRERKRGKNTRTLWGLLVRNKALPKEKRGKNKENDSSRTVQKIAERFFPLRSDEKKGTNLGFTIQFELFCFERGKK
ncbi:hypothetical protein TNCT_228051 [Trichonephila clavata]|uniref:Uncharacterized protein n=1 Tax=Trichonephila clavata TaxID=2740835 RepID=A0A8X6HS42_TRICU|nr:hypothetical protein TNCT_228051 [Trichonephila clavata]